MDVFLQLTDLLNQPTFAESEGIGAEHSNDLCQLNTVLNLGDSGMKTVCLKARGFATQSMNTGTWCRGASWVHCRIWGTREREP